MAEENMKEMLRSLDKIHKIKAIILFIIGFIGNVELVSSQDVLSRTQIFHAIEWQSPAMAGIQNNMSADIMYRQALNGYGSNSGYIQAGFFYPIKKVDSKNISNSSFAISNPEKAEEFYNSRSARRKQGVGLQLNSIQLGPLDRTEIKGFYAYHIPINSKYNLSLGSALKFQQNSIGFDNLNVRDKTNDDLYQRLINDNSGRHSNVQMDLSLAYYSRKLYLSFVVNSLFTQSFKATEMAPYMNDGMNFSLMAGYKWNLNSELSLLPNAEINYFATTGGQYKSSVRLKYKELVYIGMGMHHQLKWSGLLGFNVPGNFFVNYSYDYYTGFIQEFSNGVHEVSLSFLFNNKNSSTPYTW
ncbi:PorP/SprF family type IX secretion system membrane protein [Marivirga tractuosa]|uniref:PorP/SprF family type IX secretion system membrane protein n=1 Tax=Marivirga tractuosa TaxID=1006 RepID=UPI0035CF2C94